MTTLTPLRMPSAKTLSRLKGSFYKLQISGSVPGSYYTSQTSIFFLPSICAITNALRVLGRYFETSAYRHHKIHNLRNKRRELPAEDNNPQNSKENQGKEPRSHTLSHLPSYHNIPIMA